jgi:hypothetical protein
MFRTAISRARIVGHMTVVFKHLEPPDTGSQCSKSRLLHWIMTGARTDGGIHLMPQSSPKVPQESP